MFLWPYFLCSSSGKVFEKFHFIFFSNTDFWPCFHARKLPLLNAKQLQSHRFSLFLIGTKGFPPVVSSSGVGEHQIWGTEDNQRKYRKDITEIILNMIPSSICILLLLTEKRKIKSLKPLQFNVLKPLQLNSVVFGPFIYIVFDVFLKKILTKIKDLF